MLQTTAHNSLAIGTPFADEDPATRLLRRIARQDRQAMAEFYTRFQESVFRFALSRTGDANLAGEVLNDTMLCVWLDADRFRGDAQVLTWVLGIAFRKSMDQMRRSLRHPAEPLDEDLRDEGASVDLCEVLQRMDDIQRVHAAIDKLSEAHRVALHLAFFEDLPYAEIATVLGCPEGTVKTRVFHAKQMLKRLLLAA